MPLKTLARLMVASTAIVFVGLWYVLGAVDKAEQQIGQALDVNERIEKTAALFSGSVELLSFLVQSFTTTGEVRYLDVYYDILDVWHGRQPMPEGDPLLAWREAARHARKPPRPVDGLSLAVVERVRLLGFDNAEQEAVSKVLLSIGEVQEIEKVAFAATQGLYDRHTGQFVSDGTPDVPYAVSLVHSAEYEARQDRLRAALVALNRQVEQRTEAEIATARARLGRAVHMSIVFTVFVSTSLIVIGVFVQRRVIRPIIGMEALMRHYADGDYAHRMPADKRAVAELGLLAATTNQMAQAIEADLSSRDLVQRELTDARDQAEAAARAKSAFLANMSHEIRTPMNAIMGMTQLLLRTDLSVLQRGYVDNTWASSRHLLLLLNDILDFSKIEAGGMTIESAPFRIEDVVTRTMGLVRARALEKNLELLCRFCNPAVFGHLAVVRGDMVRLGQVLVNLVGNAVKFTASGSVVLEIDARQEQPGDGTRVALTFSVRDTGIGIDEVQLGRLFSEFSQADDSITRRYGGSGLGLAISGRLVELMGGRIEVTSTPQVGSCFTVHLSLPIEAAGPVEVCPEAVRRRRVLVVEDLPATLALATMQLQQLGIGSEGVVATAATGMEALAQLDAALAQGRPFDTLLLDWVLPDMGGEEVLRRARAQQADLDVIVLTAYDATEIDAVRARGEPLRLIDKPLLPNSLRAVFHSHQDAAADVLPDTGWLGGMRVLLAEDNALNSQVTVSLLEQVGARVDSVCDGQQALDRLLTGGPDAYDVVLMDLQMPLLDGHSAVRRLREDHRFDGLPVLALTANAMPEEVARCRAAGMQGYLTKPFLIDDLVAELKRCAPGVVTVGRRASLASPMMAPNPTLPAIAGIDGDSLLAHCGGSAGLAAALLRGFVEDYAAGVAGWRQWIEAGDWPTLQRAAHTLLGLVGTLGADALRPIAQQMDEAARVADAGRVGALVGLLDAELMPLLAAIGHAMENALLPRPGQADAASPNDGAAQPDLDIFRAYLADSDGAALDWWKRHQASLASRLGLPVQRAVRAALDRYDFDLALEALADCRSP